jgi:hypothetical protein
MISCRAVRESSAKAVDFPSFFSCRACINRSRHSLGTSYLPPLVFHELPALIRAELLSRLPIDRLKLDLAELAFLDTFLRLDHSLRSQFLIQPFVNDRPIIEDHFFSSSSTHDCRRRFSFGSACAIRFHRRVFVLCSVWRMTRLSGYERSRHACSEVHNASAGRKGRSFNRSL